MRKLLFALGLVALCAMSAFGQAPQLQPFSLTSTAMALPGGKSTVAATDQGFSFTPTPNFDLRYDTFIAPNPNSSSTFTAFFGGFNYRLPILSTKVNNVSPTINGFRFQFYITGSAGVDRVTDSSGVTKQHYSFLGGGGVNYDLTQSGKWTLGVEAEYAKLPGLVNNTAVVKFGPAIHF